MIKTLELRAQRVKLGISAKHMADLLGICEDLYRKRETGKIPFRLSETIIVFYELQLTLKQFNDIFYDGKLPIGQCEMPCNTCNAQQPVACGN